MRLHFLSFLSLPVFAFALQGQQIVMNSDEQYTPLTSSQPTLADLLTIEPSVSIFYSYARELELSSLLSDNRAKSTVFVPTNKAVMALSRKPHQGPVEPIDDDIEISEQEFDRRSKNNVQNWISAHIVPESPIVLDSHQYNTLLRGKSITFKPITKGDKNGPEWSRVTLEDGIHIVGMREGLNGVLYMIDGTISYESVL